MPKVWQPQLVLCYHIQVLIGPAIGTSALLESWTVQVRRTFSDVHSTARGAQQVRACSCSDTCCKHRSSAARCTRCFGVNKHSASHGRLVQCKRALNEPLIRVGFWTFPCKQQQCTMLRHVMCETRNACSSCACAFLRDIWGTLR